MPVWRLPVALALSTLALVGAGAYSARKPQPISRASAQAAVAPDLDGWVRAILTGRERMRAELAGKPAPIATGVMRGGMAPVAIRLDLTGQADLYLAVQSAPTYDYGQSAWGEPELVASDGSVTRLTDLQPAEQKVGWGTLLINKNVAGAAIKLAGRTMAFGYWAHADSLLHFKLDRPYAAFQACAGIDDQAGTNGHVRFLAGVAPPAQAGASGYSAEADRILPALADRSGALLLGDLDAAGLRRAAREALDEAERARLAGQLPLVSASGLRLALDDLAAATPDRYRDAPELRRRIAALPRDLAGLAKRTLAGEPEAVRQARGIVDLQREVLLRNPALDFDRVLAIRRSPGNMGLPANFNSNADLARRGYDNALVEISLHGRRPARELFRPTGGRFVGDLCLHFNADRLLFSMPDDQDRWHVWEAGLDTMLPLRVTPDMGADVDSYDACYTPGGDVLFTCTAGMVAVPCVGGASPVATIFRLQKNGTVSQLCFDQEHNWTPRVMADGSVLYQRWEYTDTPHSNTRLLFTMNPDGTNQREFYGSNSYWPAAFFYAQPVPGKPNQVVGISSGHHGPARTGELVLLDVARGRQEARGAVTRIPGRGKPVQGKIYDHMENVWPNFVHPSPITDKLFLVACQPSADQPWGLYLADIYDNLLQVAAEPGWALLEPTPIRAQPAPPVIPDRVKPDRKDAVLQIQDIYRGPGLKGIPRGTVKSVRIFSYTFGYRGVGGLYGIIGMDGPWDIHRVLGTAPVRPDGSASIRVPANVPLSIQPLNANGQALALMRSWLTARPGEVLACVGCHESQSSGSLARAPRPVPQAPAPITPWRPQTVGFSFEREVQPVLDRQCVSCHQPGGANPDLEGGKPLRDWSSQFAGNGGGNAGRFSTSYANLFPFVRNNGIEGDYHVLSPMEFHFSATELGKMLRKGHHGVNLDRDAMDRLVTWHDMNRPYHGSWSSIVGQGIVKSEVRRAELRRKYANVDENHEEPAPDRWPGSPAPTPRPKPVPAARAVAASGLSMPPLVEGKPSRALLRLKLGAGQSLALVRAPAGEFAMGSDEGHPDEAPVARVRIRKPFWIGATEVTNAQYRLFDPNHDSRVADALSYQFGQRPWSLNEPDQPVCRVSWQQAMAFCRWLSARTGRRVTLPTEAQWEWACRAGSGSAYSFGPMGADYASYANLGDKRLSLFAADTSADNYFSIRTIANPNRFDDWIPKDAGHDDGNQLAARPGAYKPNPWGLADMHGNVAEWTRSLYAPYPYRDDDGRNDPRVAGERVVRGGSWWTRPFQATSSYRTPYAPYQPVMDTGFRIVVEE
ncbi:MAG: SUMF1/EgtB/PvdO family nonheme iron enzyme [Armatimonadetes bacterium]|nr:SUMF1/EgtB/PvdO family nonheme iron enzyme [Armatimonadota bacterium]